MLHQLIERQNLDELNKILRERPLSLDLNERNAANQSPLHVAASIGDELVSCLLIDSYAVNMEIEDIWKRTPLLTAAKFEQLGVCESLLKRSANPSARDIDGNSILHLLSTAKSADAILYTRVLQTCLSSPNWSLDINSQNNDGDTPLHLAASAGNEKALLFLVNQPNVNLNAKNGAAITPVQLAARSGRKTVLNILLGMSCESEGLEADEKQGLLPPESIAIRNARSHVSPSSSSSSSIPSRRLTTSSLPPPTRLKADSVPERKKEMSFYDAVKSANINEVKAALKKDKNLVKKKFELSQTPLHVAVLGGSLEIVKLFLEKLAKQVGEQDDQGNTPLHLACQEHMFEIAAFLIQQKASASVLNFKGRNVIHMLTAKPISTDPGFQKTLKLILSQNDCDINQPDVMGNTPLHLAAGNGDEKAVFFLASTGAQIEAKNLNGHTPIELAALQGKQNIVSILVSLGANVDGLQQLIDDGQIQPEITSVLASKTADMRAARERKSYLLLSESNQAPEAIPSNSSVPATMATLPARTLLPSSSSSSLPINSTASSLPAPPPPSSSSSAISRGDAIKLKALKGPISIAKLKAPKSARAGLSQTDSEEHKIDFMIMELNFGHDLAKLIKKDRSVVNKLGSAGLNLLHFASLSGKTDVVVQLIDKYKALINIPSLTGKNAFLFAIKSNNLEICELLLARNADPSLPSPSGKTAIHYLSSFKVIHKHKVFSLLKFLLDCGISVNAAEKKSGNTALHIAATRSDPAMIVLLSFLGASINATNHEGLTPLQLAARQQSNDNVQKLIQRGALTKSCDSDIEAGLITEDTAKVIRETKPDPSEPIIEEVTEKFVSLQQQLNINPILQRTAISTISRASDVSRKHPIQDLLKIGPSAKNEIQKIIKREGKEILGFFDSQGHNGLQICAREGHLELLQILVEKIRVPLDKKDNQSNYTALHIACARSQLRCAKYLIEKGANLKVLSSLKESCLHLLSSLTIERDDIPLYKETIDLAVQAGMEVNAIDAHGNSPLHRAGAIGNNVGIAILMDHKAKGDLKNYDGKTPVELAALANQKATVRVFMTKNVDTLWVHDEEAIQGISEDIITLLKNKESSISSISVSVANSVPVLTSTISAGSLSLSSSSPESSPAISSKSRFRVITDQVTQLHNLLLEGNKVDVKRLLRKEKDPRETIHAQNRSGLNAIHFAAKLGYTDLLSFFFEKLKGDPNSLDDASIPPICYAAQNRHLSCAIVLLEHGSKLHCHPKDGRTALHHFSMLASLPSVPLPASATSSGGTLPILTSTGGGSGSGGGPPSTSISAPVTSLAESVQRFLQLVIEKTPESIDLSSFTGDTALHCAAASGNEPVVMALLNSKLVDINAINRFGETPIQLAAQNNRKNIVKRLITMEGCDTLGLEYDLCFNHQLSFDIREIIESPLLRTNSKEMKRFDEFPALLSSTAFSEQRMSLLVECLYDASRQKRKAQPQQDDDSNEGQLSKGQSSASEFDSTSTDHGLSSSSSTTRSQRPPLSPSSRVSSPDRGNAVVPVPSKRSAQEPEEQDCDDHTDDVGEGSSTKQTTFLLPPSSSNQSSKGALQSKKAKEQPSKASVPTSGSSSNSSGGGSFTSGGSNSALTKYSCEQQLSGFSPSSTDAMKRLYSSLSKLTGGNGLSITEFTKATDHLVLFDLTKLDIFSLFQRVFTENLGFLEFVNTVGLAYCFVSDHFPPDDSLIQSINDETFDSQDDSLSPFDAYSQLFSRLASAAEIIEPLEVHSSDIVCSFWTQLQGFIQSSEKSSQNDFKNYFNDQITDKKTLQQVIDLLSDHTPIIDSTKFGEFFSFAGPQSQFFATIVSAFNTSIKAFANIRQAYSNTQSAEEQFKLRMQVREIIRSLEVLLSNTEALHSEMLSILPVTSSSSTYNQLDKTAQILRNEMLRSRETVHQLLAPRNPQDFVVMQNNKESKESLNAALSSSQSERREKLVVTREVHALGKDISSLSSVLNEYNAWTFVDSGCIHSRIEHSSEQSLQKKFVQVQVWDDAESLAKHYSSTHFKRYSEASGPLKAFENVSITRVS